MTLNTVPTRLRASLLWLWAIMLVAAPAVYTALSQPIERIAHDASEAHIYRGVVFSSAISDGVLYPRWVQLVHLGLGGPLFTFQPPLPFYGMDFLYRLGIPHPLGWRVLIAIGFVIGCGGMFLLVRRITQRPWPSLAAAAAFTYAPYVLLNAFDRGSNEVYSMFLYPLVLWALLRVAQRPSLAGVGVAAFIWAACIGFHVLGPLMLLPVVAIAALIVGWRYRTVTPFLALVAGGLLMAFVWMPIIPEVNNVRIQEIRHLPDTQPDQHPILLSTLLAPPPLFDTKRDDNWIGYQAGRWHLLALVGSAIAAIIAWRAKRTGVALAATLAVLLGVLVIWLLTPTSTAVWRLLSPLLGLLEFRYRLLGLFALASACAVGVVVAVFPPRVQRIVGFGLVGLFIATAIPSLYVQYMHQHGTFGRSITLEEVRQQEIDIGGNAFTSFGETIPRWRTAPLTRETALAVATSPLADASHPIELQAATIRTSQWNLTAVATAPTLVTLHLLYYPRWRAYIDGHAVPLSYQPESGLIQLTLPTGRHEIALRYQRTVAEQAGLLISGFVLALLLLGIAKDATGRSQRRHQAEAGERLIPTRAGNPSVRWLLLFTGLFLVKVLYIDPQTTWFRCVSTEAAVCGVDHPVNVRFEGGHSLVGYSVISPQLAAGDTVRLRLVWRAEENVDRRLHTFVHIRSFVQTPGDIAQQTHHIPGGLPSTSFLPNRYYLDAFELPLPDTLPPGEYQVEIGWFDPSTSEQLDPRADSVAPPLKILWRSILLPPITVSP